MPNPKKPSFQIIVGTSTKSPELAAQDAERKARQAIRKAGGGEQVSIAASVLGGSASSALQDQMLDNIARNIYQLVQCACPQPVIIGQEIKTAKVGVPPPLQSFPIGATASVGALWVVYILLRH